MFCNKKCFTLICNKWFFVNTACSMIFLVHVCKIGLAIKNQGPTELRRNVMKLQDMEKFPVLFKLCPKPGGFNVSSLKEEGYNDIADYFYGFSRYNKSLYGWAGHTRNGSVRSSVKGKANRGKPGKGNIFTNG